MEHNNYTMSSPMAWSERKDSQTYPIYSFGKKTDGKDDFTNMSFDFFNDDNHNDNHSIFNLMYSPQPRMPEYNHLKTQGGTMIPFPVLTYPSITESPKSANFDPSKADPTLCLMFGVGDNSKEKPSNDGDSNVDDSLESIFDQSQKNNKMVNEYLTEIMNYNETETKNFREFENNIKSKGLKLLSIIVFDIVTEKVMTSYKEVADLILKDTINSPQSCGDKKTELSREEQNIKRRVYDVLNVLISANTFLKDGKIVKKNDIDPNIMAKNKRAELNSMYSKLVSL